MSRMLPIFVAFLKNPNTFLSNAGKAELFLVLPLNYRITGLEETFKIIKSNPCPNTSTDHGTECCIQSFFNYSSKDGDSTISLGRQFLCLITFA